MKQFGLILCGDLVLLLSLEDEETLLIGTFEAFYLGWSNTDPFCCL